MNLDDLKVMVYELEYDWVGMRGITLERTPGRRYLRLQIPPRDHRWAIRHEGSVLGKTSIDGAFLFTFEPIPSSRDEKFYLEHRWQNAEEALRFWTENRGRIVATVAEERAWYERVTE